MSYGAMEIPSGAQKHLPRQLHRQAMAAIAGICAVTLVAACVVLNRGSVYTGLLEVRNERLPYARMSMLVNSPAWKDEEIKTQMLAEEKKQVGSKLASEMKKMWHAKDKADKAADEKKFSKLKTRFESILSAMEKAPILRQLPETSRPGMRVVDPRTGKVYQLYDWKGYDPEAAGDVVAWEPNPLHADDMAGLGDFEDFERDPIYQGEYPDYAAIVPPFGGGGPVVVKSRGQPQLKVPQGQRLYDYDPVAAGDTVTWEPHPLHADDMKGLADFPDASGRVETYQGVYPDYDKWDDFQGNIVPSGSLAGKAVVNGQTLYDYDPVAAGDTVTWEPHPMFANDLKGFADFETDPAERIPIYQGEYPDYETWPDFQGNIAPSGGGGLRALPGQTLYPYDPVAQGDAVTWEPHPIFAGDMKGVGDFATDPAERVYTYQGAYPDYDTWNDFQGNIAPSGGAAGAGMPVALAIMDENGQLRLVNPAEIQGLQLQELMAHRQLLARRSQMQQQLALMRRAGTAQAKKAAAPKAAAKATAAPKAAKAAPKAVAKAPKTAKAQKQAAVSKAGQIQMLADLDSSGIRTWGKVYDPKLLPLPAQARSVDPNPMTRQARDEYKHWSSLADKLNDVYDPSQDKSAAHNMPKHMGLGKNANWWSAKHYDAGSAGGGSDAWWTHNHAGRGY